MLALALIVLASAAFSLLTIVVILFLRRRRAGPWMLPSLFALALAPVAASVAWSAVSMMRMFQGLAAAGSGGLGAVAAGILEARVPVLFALISALALSSVAFLLAILLSFLARGSGDRARAVGVSAGRAVLVVGLPLLLVAATFGLLLLDQKLALMPVQVLAPGAEDAPAAQTSARIAHLLMLGMAGGVCGAALLVLSGALGALFAPAPAPTRPGWVAGTLLFLALAASLGWSGLTVHRSRQFLEGVALTGRIPGTEPQAEPAAATDSESQGVEETEEGVVNEVPGSVEGGVEGGVVGGIIGGEPEPFQGPYIVGGDVAAPELVTRVDPVYPEAAKQAHLQAIVILQAVIDDTGKVTDVKVLRGAEMGLTEAATTAVRQWTYKPGRKGGKPVPVLLTVTVQFRMQ